MANSLAFSEGGTLFFIPCLRRHFSIRRRVALRLFSNVFFRFADQSSCERLALPPISFGPHWGKVWFKFLATLWKHEKQTKKREKTQQKCQSATSNLYKGPTRQRVAHQRQPTNCELSKNVKFSLLLRGRMVYLTKTTQPTQKKYPFFPS